MAKLNIMWQDNSKPPQTKTLEQQAKNPLVSKIISQTKTGIPKNKIMENLMQQGHPYRHIKNAYDVLHKINQPRLDWRSPTAINETARLIRKDIRAKRITYSTGMRVLLQARDNLAMITKTPNDRRLQQIRQEIKTTKRLLMNQYGDPRLIQQYHIKGRRN